VLGVDDAPFEKGQRAAVPIVGVMMEGADLVECVAIGSFAVDGHDATGFLADWIPGLRSFASLQAVILGGITLAGLGIVDVGALATRLGLPVLSVTRRDPIHSQLDDALRAAGFDERLAITGAALPAFQLREGLFISHAGIDREGARRIARATLRKSNVPEPLRMAHLVARALVDGESRGRV
jgi:endonuclease V-like protein UPF0215 family